MIPKQGDDILTQEEYLQSINNDRDLKKSCLLLVGESDRG